MLNERELDWAYTMAALYAADVACQRGIDREWTRRIELHVPVRAPQSWSSLRIRIEELFGRLTYDQLRLHFHRRTSDVQPPRQRQTGIRPEVDCVALLSGGVDSYVGAVMLVSERERVPIFVSHTGAPAARDAQNALRPLLRGRGPVEFAPFSAQRTSGFGEREGSERSRTMLFVGCAGVVASATGVRDVFLNENGVLAIHLPMTEARVGSLSTRTAAPSFVDEMTDLMSEALSHEVTVRNELVTLTKPDVVAHAQAMSCAADLIHTVSCWSIGHTRRHCGFCAPCMIRRIALGIHEISDAPYDNDVFRDENVLTRPFAHDNLVQLIASLTEVASASDAELELEYPELLTSGSGLSTVEARDLHRRWAQQALGFLRSQPLPQRVL